MAPESFAAFGRRFSARVAEWKDELLTLEREAAVYSQWSFDEDDGGPGLYRVHLLPGEIYGYVSALVGWDEYLDAGFASVSDRDLAARAAASARQRTDIYGSAMAPCVADFLGDDLEDLLCGGRPERAERLHPRFSAGEASVMLHGIATCLPTAAKALTDRSANRPPYTIDDERDLQDLLFVLLRSVFPDTRREEWAPGHAGSSKRMDLIIPSGRTIVETKFVRDRAHGRRVADELKIDIESYHGHPACGTLFALVWDTHRHLADPQQLERDLTGRRAKRGSRFDVAVRVV